jgi:hypothetical protein
MEDFLRNENNTWRSKLINPFLNNCISLLEDNNSTVR